jgi:hypothetical protein
MNFELADDISKHLADDKLEEAISLAETNLRELPSTDFNKLLGKNLLHQTDQLVDFFTNFYETTRRNLPIKAVYVEMNGFTINCDLWFLDLFAFDKVGGTDDTDWLSDWEEENSTLENFTLTGYEELQQIYQDFLDNEKYKDNRMQAASEVAELLIVLRLQELVKSALIKAKQKNLPWSVIPFFASAHDYYNLVYRVS